MAAINQTSVPWCTVIVRNSFGVAGAIHQPSGRLALRYAWPSAYWGSLPLEGGIEAAYRRELEASADPKKLREELVRRHEQKMSPFRSAEAFDVEEIIDPRDTRRILCRWVEDAYAAQVGSLGPKHRGVRP